MPARVVGLWPASGLVRICEVDVAALSEAAAALVSAVGRWVEALVGIEPSRSRAVLAGYPGCGDKAGRHRGSSGRGVIGARPDACGAGRGFSGTASGALTSESGTSTLAPGSPNNTSTQMTSAQVAAVADGATLADTDSSGIEWLCRPGRSQDPCVSDLTATVACLRDLVDTARLGGCPSRIDCFYVYPTVSPQPGVLANLHIDPAETAVAQAQASRFSQVFASMPPCTRS